MPTGEDFAADDDYALRWPADLFADVLRRLVNGARPTDQEWVEEVELLLREAFASTAPLEEFRRRVSTRLMPSDDDVPF